MVAPFQPPRPSGRFQNVDDPASMRGRRAGLMLCVLVLVFGTGLAVGRHGAPGGAGVGAAPPLENAESFAILENTWRVIQEEYVDLESVDQQALIYGASEGMVDALGDTGHSRFLDPEDARAFTRSMSGRRVGVGIRLEQVGEQVIITGVMDGTPAARGGLVRGDIIVAVDGQALDRLSRDEMADLFWGEEGSLLDLTLRRPGQREVFDVSLQRELLTVEPVSWGMLPDSVGFIRISEFSAGTAKGVQEAVAAIQDAGATSAVLDLRDNPGGLVFEAIAVASQFMPEESVVFQQEERDGSVNTFKAMPDGVALNLPLVVLINEGSASAAEIVAGALRDNGRARLLGETTYGTGTVLSSVELDDGSLVVIGTGLWLTPDGQSIWKEGVEPDEDIPLEFGVYPLVPDDDNDISSAELSRSDDTQLQAAQEQAARLAMTSEG